jgi:hypothetical protein
MDLSSTINKNGFEKKKSGDFCISNGGSTINGGSRQ